MRVPGGEFQHPGFVFLVNRSFIVGGGRGNEWAPVFPGKWVYGYIRANDHALGR
jgi:hypothetical protein